MSEDRKASFTPKGRFEKDDKFCARAHNGKRYSVKALGRCGCNVNFCVECVLNTPPACKTFALFGIDIIRKKINLAPPPQPMSAYGYGGEGCILPNCAACEKEKLEDEKAQEEKLHVLASDKGVSATSIHVRELCKIKFCPTCANDDMGKILTTPSGALTSGENLTTWEVPFSLTEAVARRFMLGRKRSNYPFYNWEKGLEDVKFLRSRASHMETHMKLFLNGVEGEDDMIANLDAIACNLTMLIESAKRDPQYLKEAFFYGRKSL